MRQVNVYEAKTQLSKLIDAAAGGEEIVIARAGRPVAKLVPVEPRPAERRRFGLLKGKIWVAPDWDSPEVNEEIARTFYEGDLEPT